MNFRVASNPKHFIILFAGLCSDAVVRSACLSGLFPTGTSGHMVLLFSKLVDHKSVLCSWPPVFSLRLLATQVVFFF